MQGQPAAPDPISFKVLASLRWQPGGGRGFRLSSFYHPSLPPSPMYEHSSSLSVGALEMSSGSGARLPWLHRAKAHRAGEGCER